MTTKAARKKLKYRLMPAENKMIKLMGGGLTNNLMALRVLKEKGTDLNDNHLYDFRYLYLDAVEWLNKNPVPVGIIGETFAGLVREAHGHLVANGHGVADMPEVLWVAKDEKYSRNEQDIETAVDFILNHAKAFAREKEAQRRDWGEDATWALIDTRREKRTDASEYWTAGRRDELTIWYSFNDYQVEEAFRNRASKTEDPDLLRTMVSVMNIRYMQRDVVQAIVGNPYLSEDVWRAIVNERTSDHALRALDNPEREAWVYRWVESPDTAIEDVVSVMGPISDEDTPREKLSRMARARVMKDVTRHLGSSSPWVAFRVAACIIHEKMTAADFDELFASLSQEELEGATKESHSLSDEISEGLNPPGPGVSTPLDDFIRMTWSHHRMPVAIMEAWILRDKPEQTLRWFPMLAYYLVAVIKPNRYDALEFQASKFDPSASKYAKYRDGVTIEDEFLAHLIGLVQALSNWMPKHKDVRPSYESVLAFMQSNDVPTDGAIAKRMKYALADAEAFLATKPRPLNLSAEDFEEE